MPYRIDTVRTQVAVVLAFQGLLDEDALADLRARMKEVRAARKADKASARLSATADVNAAAQGELQEAEAEVRDADKTLYRESG